MWEALAPVILHPLQVVILEDLEWIERPLSATELAKLFGDPEITHSLLILSRGLLRLRRLVAEHSAGLRLTCLKQKQSKGENRLVEQACIDYPM